MIRQFVLAAVLLASSGATVATEKVDDNFVLTKENTRGIISVTSNGERVFYARYLKIIRPGKKGFKVNQGDGYTDLVYYVDEFKLPADKPISKTMVESKQYTALLNCKSYLMQKVSSGGELRFCKGGVTSNGFVSVSFSNELFEGVSKFYYGSGTTALEAKQNSMQRCLQENFEFGCTEVFNASPIMTSVDISNN